MELIIACVITLISIMSFILLIHTKEENQKIRTMYALFLVAFLFGYTPVLLRLYLDKTSIMYLALKYIFSSISFRFSPYFLLMSSVFYSRYLDKEGEKKAKYLLFLPLLLTYIIDLIYPNLRMVNGGFSKSPLFWVTTIWAVPYTVISLFLFLNKFLMSKGEEKRLKLYIFICNLPFLVISFVSYKIVDINTNQWILSILMAMIFIILTFVLSGRNLWGIKFAIENDLKIGSSKGEFKDRISYLTPRQKEIFDLILLGKSDEEITNELFISPGTLKNHISEILRKCKSKDRKELVFKYENEV